jgi:ATP-dependent Lon protease
VNDASTPSASESVSTDHRPKPPALILPVLPLKSTVLFPYLFAPLSVGRPASVAAVEAALANEEKTLIAIAQRNGDSDHLTAADLYAVGTRAVVKKMVRNEENLELLVQGMERVTIRRLEEGETYLRAEVEPLPLPDDTSPEVDALYRSVIELASKAIEVAQPQALPGFQQMVANTPEPMRLVYLLGSMISLDVQKEQSLLEASSRHDALQLLHGYLTREVQVLELRQKIASQAQSEITKEQRDYMLRQQLRAIQDELGEKSPEKADIEALQQRLKEANLPEDVRKEADRSLARLERLPSMAPDYQVTRSHLELLLELPWRVSTQDQLDLVRTRQILDEDHFDLADVKQRIVEFLAVLKLNPSAKAPILCFVGPPGVGKTSLGQSIARSMGRKFERMSLGGLHDEAELRGHRRTYIGAMPGRIIQAIRRAGVNNPMLMLDEIDKLGRDFRGDPSSALLEILDPAQNNTFRDNYVDLPFDLSKVLFVATANSLDPLPRPLLDRMEVLRLSGYSEEEKFEIARRFIIPRVMGETGIKPDQVVIPDETLRRLIKRYTREAGCRQLERTIARLLRKLAVRFAEGSTEKVTIEPDQLVEQIGREYFIPDKPRPPMPPGVATGLAWTETGGEVLYIEATELPGLKRLRLTGQLGKVMRESAKTAQSYVLSHGQELGIDPKILATTGVHIHVPAGAVPKDGPSAGVAMATALTSLFANIPVRSDTAMTGEITLAGLVLPIGGVKEKVLAARRNGMKRVILPRDNESDARELPENVRKEVEIIFADRIGDVLAAALPGLHQRCASPVPNSK